MSDWIYDRNGNAAAIFDGDCIRNNAGRVAAWISESNVYSLFCASPFSPGVEAGTLLPPGSEEPRC